MLKTRFGLKQGDRVLSPYFTNRNRIPRSAKADRRRPERACSGKSAENENGYGEIFWVNKNHRLSLLVNRWF